MTAANTDEPIENSHEPAFGDDAIEAVAFLARSEHRLRVLALLDDGVHSRTALGEHTGVSRVTLSRILNDLADRTLIEHDPTENTYALTGFGELVYADFARLLGTVSVGQAVPDVVDRLPTEWFDFELRCLSESTLVAPDSDDPLAAARVVANAVQGASSFHALLGTFISLPMYTFEDAVRSGDPPDGVVLFDASLTETMVDDADLRNRWRHIEAEIGSTVYYTVDDPVPCSIDLIDGDTVFLTVDREQHSGFDILRCTHPAVVRWARETIERQLADATPLDRCLSTRS